MMTSGDDADYCELTMIDAAGSAAFGSLFSGVEAWVCQDSEATSLHKIELQQKHERRSLMHQGQMVQAFSTSPIALAREKPRRPPAPNLFLFKHTE